MLKELKGSAASHKGRQRARRKKFAWRMVVVIVFLLVLGVIVGLLYVWYNGQTSTVTITKPTPKYTNTPKPAVKVADNQPVGVSITALTSPVAPGSNSSVQISTLPQAACSVEVLYNGAKSGDTGLVPKIADEYGSLSWSWKVDLGVPKGKWPVNITCARNEKSGYVRGDLIVE